MKLTSREKHQLEKYKSEKLTETFIIRKVLYALQQHTIYLKMAKKFILISLIAIVFRVS